MHRRMAVLVGITSLFFAAAAPAQAEPAGVWVQEDAPPIRVTLPIGQSADTGFVGICDHFGRCTGFSIAETTSDITFGTNPGSVEAEAWVCVHETDAPCSTNGNPFTGVRITKLSLDVPEPYVEPIVVWVRVCFWVLSPEGTPSCADSPLADIGLAPHDGGNVLPALPGGIGLELPA